MGVCSLLPVLHGRNGRRGSRHQPGIIPGGAAGGLKEAGGTVAGPSGFLLRECGPIGEVALPVARQQPAVDDVGTEVNVKA